MEIHIEPRNLTLLPEWEEKIREEISRIDRHNAGLIHSMRLVLIGTAHHKLGAFEVHITCGVPNRNLVVMKKGSLVMPLLVEAFNVLDSEMIEFNRERQDTVSREEKSYKGTIRQIFPEEDYGFISGDDGSEVYFHRNAVKHADFSQLRAGDQVKFGQEPGDKGLQATWIRAKKK